MADVKLHVEPREVLGKKVRVLRSRGLTPANVYGHRVQSQALQADTATLTQLLRTAGRNVIIDLHVEGETKARPVVVRGAQRDPVNDKLLHVDFYQVSLREKMRAEVPLVLVGEAPAVSAHGGILLQGLDTVTVEALPGDIPSSIEVDVSSLAELDAGLFVKALVLDPKIQVLTDPELVVAKVAAPRLAAEVEEELAEEEAVEEEAAEEEAAPAEEERKAAEAEERGEAEGTE
jgi:large subunit ribosomal protein L25